MIYLNGITLPDERAETRVIQSEGRTCFHTFYPFNLFPLKGLGSLSFDRITLLYGGNGSGKSTLLNVIAEKLAADRFSDFNDAPFFGKYVSLCRLSLQKSPPSAAILTSDDVFDYALSARSVNERLDEKRNALFQEYLDTHRAAKDDPTILHLRGLDDYERWKDVCDILSKRRTQSNYIKDRVETSVDLHSNGETAMRVFLNRMEEEGLFLLDEPENSLSAERQAELADYIAATARVNGSQFIIATHSPLFLAIPRAKVYNLDAVPVSTAKWTELPNVRRYFDFFMAHRDEFET